MGVSIHYKGRMSNLSCTEELHRDLLQFTDQAKWGYQDLKGPAERGILELVSLPSEMSLDALLRRG